MKEAMKARAARAAGKKTSSWRSFSLVMNMLVRLAVVLTVAVLLAVVGYILVMGVPNLRTDLFAWEYNSDNVSMVPALINTLLCVILTLSVAVPLGVMAAVFLVEYTARSNRFVKAVRLAAETLAGIPSIVYGLFGMLFFVIFLGWGLSLLAGCMTLAIMIIPTVMRTTEEALRAVPDAYREGSFALGAGRLRTVMAVVLPSAMPGILGGVILSIGRIVGESAALIFTAGSVASIPSDLFGSARTMAVHMYVLASEGLHIDATYATAVVLLILVLVINALASWVAKRLTKGEHS